MNMIYVSNNLICITTSICNLAELQLLEPFGFHYFKSILTTQNKENPGREPIIQQIWL